MGRFKTVATSLLALCIVMLAASAAVAANRDSAVTLWYTQPAARWTEALPLGNGRLGAMVFGSQPVERLQLNEESLWAGRPCDAYPDHFREHLTELQQLVLEGKIDTARQLGLEKLTKSPTSYRSFEPLTDLWIETPEGKDSITDYCRDLNLATGVATVTYASQGVHFRREVFISAVDDVLVVRLTADKPGAVAATIRLSRKKDMTVTADGKNHLRADGQIVDIAAPAGYDDNPGGSGPGGRHMKFATQLLVRTRGGSVVANGDSLVVDGADAAVLLLTAKTDYNVRLLSFDQSIDPAAEAEAILAKAAKKS